MHVLYAHIRSFFYNAPAPTEIYTLPYTTLFRSLFRAAFARSNTELSYRSGRLGLRPGADLQSRRRRHPPQRLLGADRKSTRLNSSHVEISYAVFCLKKKTATPQALTRTFLTAPP